MRVVRYFVMMLFVWSPAVKAQSFDETLKFCFVAQMWVPALLDSGDISGQDVCRVGGGSACSLVNNIGQGICEAGDGSACSLVNNIGQGICEAGDGSACSLVNNIGQGICEAGDGSACSLVNNIGQGICEAGDGSACSLVNNIGQGICEAGDGSACSLVSSMGEGICKASGGYNCGNKRTHEAICDFTKNCEGYDAVSLVNSVMSVCGPEVLHFGIPKYH